MSSMCVLFSTGKRAWNNYGAGKMDNFRIVLGLLKISKKSYVLNMSFYKIWQY